MDLINKKEYTKELLALKEYLDTRNLSRIETKFILNVMLEFLIGETISQIKNKK